MLNRISLLLSLALWNGFSWFSSTVMHSSFERIRFLEGPFLRGFHPDDQRIQQVKSRSKRFAHERPTRITDIMQLYDRLNRDYHLCEWLSDEELTMPGDVLNDADVQFESQARLALTISHFLSSFYQIINPAEDFPLRQAELQLTDEQLIGEVLSAAGADYKVVGVGIFFDRGKFQPYPLPYFGPYAYRTEQGVHRKYTVVDWAGLSNGYANEPWFRVIKQTISRCSLIRPLF